MWKRKTSYQIVNINAFDTIKESFEYESRKSKLKFTIHIVINIKKE